MLDPQFLTAVQDVPHITDPELMEKYRSDLSGVVGELPSIVFRPKTTEQVAQVVKACNQFHVHFVPQGGRTGVAAGACVQKDEAVISLEAMDRIEEIDELGGVALVEAGVILETLQKAAESKDWYFPLDLGGRGSCMIGGNISTNAGGNRVLRYGPMRDLVLGLEVVLPDGTVLTMLRRMLKNNTGLDLKHLFIGTEGRYGIVTRATLRLYPKPERRLSALMGVPTFKNVLHILKEAKRHLPSLSSFEVMWMDYMKEACRVCQRPIPFGGQQPIMILIETEGRNTAEFSSQFESFLEHMLQEGLADDVILPHSIEQSKELWDLRDAIGELLTDLAPLEAFDVCLPLNYMQDFVQESYAQLKQAYPHALNMLFGHVGDGNLHLTVCHLRQEDRHGVEEIVYTLTRKFEGSITAEHGIGMIKKPFLGYSRHPEEIALMQAIKNTINPHDIMNQRRVID